MGNRQQAMAFHDQAVKNVADKSNAQHLTSAYQLFSSACLTDPTWHHAWYQAGNNASDLNLLEASVACWRIAADTAKTDEEKAKTLVNLSWRLHSLCRSYEAVEAGNEAIRIMPSLTLGYINLALIHSLLCNHETMMQAALKGFEMEPDNSNAEAALSFAYLFNGNYELGFKHFECRFKWRLHQFLQYPYPKWSGEPGKTVAVFADQGLGDTLSFARFVERAAKRAKFLHLYIQPALYWQFHDAFLHLKNINLLPAPQQFPAADYWTTFVSLPFALGLTNDEVQGQAQIRPSLRPISSAWKVPDKKLHIGIAWSGSALNDINKFRNIPVTQFFELYRVPGVQLYSLQKDENNKEMHEQGGAPLIRDLTPFINDVVDTVSLMQHLDMIICCESALGHIAALAGKECWIPYSYGGRDYRIGLAGEHLMWTPKHRIFRQQYGETWTPVFEKIIEALMEKVALARAA